MKKSKLELLSELGEIITSKSGSQYVVLLTEPELVTKEYHERSITKNTLNKLGQTFSYTKNNKMIILLKNNKFYFKNLRGDFAPLSKSDIFVAPALKELYFYGKKCEFLKNYSIEYLRYYQFLKSFTSFKEVKDFLGYTFISVEDFLTLDFNSVLYFSHLPANIAIKFVNNSESIQIYKDCKRMAGENFVSPTSLTSLRNYHDELVLQQSLETLKLKSKSEVFFEHHIDKAVDGVNIKRITNEYDLYKEGLEMSHCIGYRGYNLPYKVFLSILWENERYSCQITNDKIDEIKGYRNSGAPIELINYLTNLLT